MLSKSSSLILKKYHKKIKMRLYEPYLKTDKVSFTNRFIFYNINKIAQKGRAKWAR